MVAVGVGVDTRSGAGLLTCRTGQLAHTIDTNFTLVTGLSTRPTVRAIGAYVGANTVAIDACQTLTLTQDTLLATGTGDTTLTTVSVVGFGVDTDAGAVGRLRSRTR